MSRKNIIKKSCSKYFYSQVQGVVNNADSRKNLFEIAKLEEIRNSI